MAEPIAHRPEDLDAASMRELAEAWQDHITDLVADRLGTGELRPAGQVRAAALSALTLGAAICARLAAAKWHTAVDALEHGATVEQVAAALDSTPEGVAADLRFWLHVELMLERRISRARFDEVVALLPRDGDL